MRSLAVALIALAASGCRALAHKEKPEEPSGSGQGAIVGSISMRGHEFPSLITHHAESAFFVQVDAKGNLDLDRPLHTNFFPGDGHIYLLNIPPGKYAPITAAYFHKHLRYLVRLDPETSKIWAVDVGPGKVAFLGENMLRTEGGGFWRALLKALKDLVGMLPLVSPPTVDIEGSTPRVDRTPPVEADALRAARKALAGTLWVAPIDERITAIGNPPEPITKGLIFKKKVAARAAERFKYQELLNWGAPQPVAGGLEWREPKGDAAVAVLFMTAGVDGYKPVEQYLDDMRLAGAPEDPHILTEVVLSSMTARVARYTTYLYPESALTGAAVKVFYTQTMLIAAKDGYYVLRYRAKREYFDKHLEAFRRFARYVELLGPPERER